LGEIKNFRGINAPYEEPNCPEIAVETNTMTIDETATKIYKQIISLIN